mmetsp:Transcript_27661/g.95677  ORF Transcript_27661/g.95677 Transcript_27661/m.95677 type:complete len:284 (-) Transcript_27661:70-921(-)
MAGGSTISVVVAASKTQNARAPQPCSEPEARDGSDRPLHRIGSPASSCSASRPCIHADCACSRFAVAAAVSAVYPTNPSGTNRPTATNSAAANTPSSCGAATQRGSPVSSISGSMYAVTRSASGQRPPPWIDVPLAPTGAHVSVDRHQLQPESAHCTAGHTRPRGHTHFWHVVAAHDAASTAWPAYDTRNTTASAQMARQEPRWNAARAGAASSRRRSCPRQCTRPSFALLPALDRPESPATTQSRVIIVAHPRESPSGRLRPGAQRRRCDRAPKPASTPPPT